jgi:hypothetical protein
MARIDVLISKANEEQEAISRPQQANQPSQAACRLLCPQDKFEETINGPVTCHNY